MEARGSSIEEKRQFDAGSMPVIAWLAAMGRGNA